MEICAGFSTSLQVKISETRDCRLRSSRMTNDSAESISELRRLVADGLTPPCPYCSSTLKVEKSTGLSGGIGFLYSCPNSSCKLKPGMARVPWHSVLVKALQQRAVQLTVAAVGSVTVAGLVAIWTGFVSIDAPATAASLPAATAEDASGSHRDLELLSIVDGLSIPVIVWDGNDTIVAVNDAACRFVQAPKEALMGKTPAYLRARIAGLITNSDEWMQDQNARELETYDGYLGQPSKVPMILRSTHPAYAGSWRIETIKLEIGGDTYWVTRYFKTEH